MNIIWAKIKCLFWFCAELKEIELRERMQVDSLYKKEPLVVEVKPTQPKTNLIKEKAKKVEKIVINKETPRKKKQEKQEKGIKKVKTFKTVKTTETAKKTKVKRSWYNNGKTQKLVPVDEVSKLAKTWKKGKLPKKDK